jgi:alpha-tubulin suppressor-like RCC1 family protein
MATGGTLATGGSVNVKLVATSITAGLANTCALLSGGRVQCWGQNPFGELGNGTTTNSYLPVPVSGITNAIAIATGPDHSCALLSGGGVQCWGENTYGELGNGTTTNSSVPGAVSGITSAVAIAAGGNTTCALLSGGRACKRSSKTAGMRS